MLWALRSARALSPPAAYAAAARQKLDRIARRHCHRRVKILVKANNDPMRIRLGDWPSQVLLLVQDDLDAQFLHARLERGETNLAITLHRMSFNDS